MKTSNSELPLSALPAVPATEDTLGRCEQAGIAVSGLQSEAAALELLADAGAAVDDAPPCFGREYGAVPRLCTGCLFAASCRRIQGAAACVVAVEGDNQAPVIPPPPAKPVRRKKS